MLPAGRSKIVLENNVKMTGAGAGRKIKDKSERLEGNSGQ